LDIAPLPEKKASNLQDNFSLNKFAIHQAANILQEGGIIAYPTEAVFGLGCDPLNENALEKLLSIKNRPAHKGLIIVASDFYQLQPFLKEIDTSIFDRIIQSWPGPTTWLLPANPQAPKLLRGKHHMQAVRVSAHPTVKALCETFGGAIVSTSANYSKRPPARSALATRIRFDKKVDFIINAHVGELKSPSEIKNAITGDIIRPSTQ
jgi:L-threonylcarbamoyladenylate synthase